MSNYDQDIQSARELQVKVFSKMGYQAEASTWRNFYLTGAQELKTGTPEKGLSPTILLDMLKQTPIERFLESMAASLNADRAQDKHMIVALYFSDLKQYYRIEVNHAVMTFKAMQQPVSDADVKLSLTKPFFLQLMTGQSGGVDLLLSKQTKIEGSRLVLKDFFALFDKAKGNFPIVTRS